MASDTTVGRILVVEDHQPTAKIIATAFDEVHSSIAIVRVQDGNECVAILQGESESGTDPDLILLDLELPGIDGFTVLEHRAASPAVRRVPMIVLSGMADQHTVIKSYEHGANAFIAKPNDFDGYLRVAEEIVGFWFETATLPAGGTADQS